MKEYRPSLPFSAALVLYPAPIEKIVAGVRIKQEPNESEGIPFFGTFRTFGGTEREINGIFGIEDTATVETWFRPEFKSGALVRVRQTGALYEIIGEPENINLRNQFLRLSLTRYKGGA